MRFAILIAALGMVAGTTTLVPALSKAAYAQTETETLSAAELALQTQIIALANAGDTAGLNALIAQQTALGNAASLAKVAKVIAANGVSLASSDPTGAAALVNAAVAIASDDSVAAADDTVGTEVGESAAMAVVAMDGSSDADAATAVASVATATKLSSNAGVGTSFYANGNTAAKQAYDRVDVPPTTPDQTSQNQGQSQGQNQNQNQNPPAPTEPVVPDIPEPNPSQSGSPT